MRLGLSALTLSDDPQILVSVTYQGTTLLLHRAVPAGPSARSLMTPAQKKDADTKAMAAKNAEREKAKAEGGAPAKK